MQERISRENFLWLLFTWKNVSCRNHLHIQYSKNTSYCLLWGMEILLTYLEILGSSLRLLRPLLQQDWSAALVLLGRFHSSMFDWPEWPERRRQYQHSFISITGDQNGLIQCSRPQLRWLLDSSLTISPDTTLGSRHRVCSEHLPPGYPERPELCAADRKTPLKFEYLTNSGTTQCFQTDLRNPPCKVLLWLSLSPATLNHVQLTAAAFQNNPAAGAPAHSLQLY